MFAAFLGGWEILIVLVIAGSIAALLVVTLVVVLLANLHKLRGRNTALPQQSSTQHSGHKAGEL